MTSQGRLVIRNAKFKEDLPRLIQDAIAIRAETTPVLIFVIYSMLTKFLVCV